MSEKRAISTEGGIYIEGQAQTDGGDFIGQDKIIHETHYHYVERPASDVPYLAPNLPPHHVPREAELAALRELLLGQEHDVAVTALRGMGGVGKTTLAIALCHDKQVIDAFPDGILWATLGPQADLLSVQAAWGTALGEELTKLPDADARASRLRSLLHGKRCLLVIDDVWDVTHLPSMQVGGPQCATLVTTRERKIAQKVGVARDLDVLEPEQALALLEQWAGEIAADEEAVAGELAKRLGYLPLALALAGAQTQDGETWDDLLAAFRDAQGADLTLLDLDDPIVRDESLALTFDLSLKRLGDALPEQFSMLGVFAAGREAPFTVEAAAAVWEVKSSQTKKMLGRLVRAALANRTDDRYTVHLLLGDYACSRLSKTTQQAAETRHNKYYLEVIQRSSEDWQTVEVALPQIRAAWNRIKKDNADLLYTWAYATNSFFARRGYWTDREIWIKTALAATKTAGQRTHEGWCERILGETFHRLGKLTEAEKHYRNSLSIAEEIGDQQLKAHSLNKIGEIYHQRGDFAESLNRYQTSLATYREIGDRKGEAAVLLSIGDVYTRYDKLDEALVHYQESLTIRREIDDRSGEARSLINVGRIYYQRGELLKALELYQDGLAVYREVGNRTGEAWSLNNIGNVYTSSLSI